MSNYSGFSSASRLQIERMSEQMEAMQALLVANGIAPPEVPTVPPVPSPSSSSTATVTATANTIKPVPPSSFESQPVPPNANLVTPSRKRHSSQQLVGAAKDIRVGEQEGRFRNRFEVLTQADSYMDKSMRPGSISSTLGVMSASAAPASTRANDFPVFTNDPIRPSSSWGNGAARPRIDNVRNGSSLVEGAFTITNEGAYREELEIGLDTINGQPFKGSITRQEAKLEIYKKCLGFGDYSNFDGVRLGYRGGPVIVFKLKNAINVDELYHTQNFNYNRKSTRQGVVHIDVIRCKIRGLRDPSRATTAGSKIEEQYTDDGTRLVKIEGCEYRVPRDVLMEYLSHFGQVVSEILEEVFEVDHGHEECDDGTNRTGDYTVKIKLTKDLPQIAPLMGKRVKFFYKGIQKLCTKCFGHHNKQVCNSRKLPWIGYVAKFIKLHPEIGTELYGRWFDIVAKEESQAGGNQDGTVSMGSQVLDVPKVAHTGNITFSNAPDLPEIRNQLCQAARSGG